MSQVTDPVMLDSTGQIIVSKLQDVIDAINGGTIDPLTVTQNGTYTPSGTTKGYGPVTVDVQGGGGSGVILSGTDAPSNADGDNEDLYIQYSVYPVPPFDYLYCIDKCYRKANGVWIDYTHPALPTIGIHVLTKSTGSTDAAMWVQKGYWDSDNQQFVTTDEAVSYTYTVASSPVNLYDLAILKYGNLKWSLTASVTLTDGTNTYTANTVIKRWGYGESSDITVWIPMT